MIQKNIDSLDKYDIVRGEDGTVVEDIVEQFGSPRNALYVISETENTLFLDYPNPDSEELLSLLFYEDKSGNFNPPNGF